MDPLSAILLIGIMTVATVKTGSAAVNDGIASAQGKPPPSQERWRAREERRRERGEQPRKDPGGVRRIWQNQMAYAAEKSAHKHQGKLDYLDRNGADIATGKRERMERADRRRQIVGGKLAQAGGASWEALRTAASKAQSRRNQTDGEPSGGDPSHPDVPDAPVISTPEGAESNRDAMVLPFQRQHQPDHVDTIRRWREVLHAGGDTRDAVSSDEWNALPSDTRDQLIAEARAAGFRVVQTRPDGSQRVIHPAEDSDTNGSARGTGRGGSGSRSTGAEPAQSTDPEHDFVRDPDDPTRRVSVAELQRRRREQAAARRRQHDADQAQADRDHAERMAGVHPDSTSTDTDVENAPDTDTARGDGHRGGGNSTGWATGSQSGPPYKQFPWHRDINWHREHYQHRMQEWDAREAEPAATDTDPDEPDPTSTDTSNNTEGASMTQHSGEITNLSDALDYVRSASEYCEQLYGQFETSLSQAHSAADDIGDEASGMETAISALTGFDLTNEAGRLAGVQERYNAIVHAMTDVETAISAAREALSTAQSDLDESAEEFQAQTGISEQMSSHDEVANDTGFYVNA